MSTAQYVMDYPADLRSQVQYIFSFGELRHPVRKALYEQFFKGIVNSFSRFEKIFDHITLDRETGGFTHNAIVLDKPAKDGHFIKFYRAIPEHEIPEFKVGRTIFYNLAKYYFTEKAMEYDIEAYALGKTSELVEKSESSKPEKKKKKKKRRARADDSDSESEVGSALTGAIRMLPMESFPAALRNQ
jgi:hypothetical protein